MGSYNVVFEGAISEGYRIADVKRNLAALFKIDEKKADILFTKPKVVLKKGIDFDSAQKYRQAILKTGAICNVREAVAVSNPISTQAATPPSPAAQALQQQVPSPATGQSVARTTETAAEVDLGESDENFSEGKSTSWLGDILAGLVLIGIGFTFGGSVFLGNPGPLDYFFDCLGVFWILRGLYKMLFVR